MSQKTLPYAMPAPRSRRGKAITTVVIVGVVIVAGILASVYFARATPGGKEQTREIYTVEKIGFDISVTANGELEAKNQTEIRNRLEKQTTITEIVDEGTRATAGQVLVRLNADEIQTQFDSEKLAVETARADVINAENAYEIQVNENESALRQAKLKLELAEIEYKKWLEGDDVEKRQKNTLDIEKTDRERVRLSEKFDRSKMLFERDFLSKDERDRDEVAAIEAEAAYRTAVLARATYEDYERPKQIKKLSSDIEEARAEVDRVQRKNESQIASKEADRTNKRSQLQLREEKLARLQEQLNSTVLKAPQDGLVVYGTTSERSRNGWGNNDGGLQIGKQVYPNQLLIVLPDTREMVASVKVHEANAGRIRPGQKAMMKVDAQPGKSYSGEVLSIGVLAESGGWRDPNLREYTVKIALDESNDLTGLKPSMRTEAEIVLGKVADVLAVPIQAVFSDGPVRYVYTPQGSKFVRTPVKTGRRSDMYVEVRAGLENAAMVLLREPAAGEVIAGGIDKDVLAALDKAAPDPPRGGGQGGPGGPGGMPPGMRQGGGGPPGAGGRPAAGAPQTGNQRGQADAAKQPGGKPAEAAAAPAPRPGEAKPAETARPAAEPAKK